MNYLIWALWIIRIAFNLIGKIGKFRKEVPEAIESISRSRQIIMEKMQGGLTVDEVQEIKVQLERTWGQVDDVFLLFSDVIPHPREEKPIEI